MAESDRDARHNNSTGSVFQACIVGLGGEGWQSVIKLKLKRALMETKKLGSLGKGHGLTGCCRRYKGGASRFKW